MAGVWPIEISIVHGLQIQLSVSWIKLKVFQKLCMNLYFNSVKLLSVLWEQLAQLAPILEL